MFQILGKPIVQFIGIQNTIIWTVLLEILPLCLGFHQLLPVLIELLKITSQSVISSSYSSRR